MKQLAVFEYAQGPHELKAGEHVFVDESSSAGPKCAWWRVEADGEYSGLVDSIAAIRSLFLSSGPFDGLMGFSQGGSFLALLLQLHNLHTTARVTHTPLTSLLPPALAHSASLAPLLSLDFSFLDSVHFALLFAAFIPRAPGLRQLFLQPPPSMPRIPQHSLHIMGEGDRNIELTASEELMAAFAHCETMRHTGGHHVPSDRDSRAVYIRFVQQQSSRREGKEEVKGDPEAAADDPPAPPIQ